MPLKNVIIIIMMIFCLKKMPLNFSKWGQNLPPVKYNYFLACKDMECVFMFNKFVFKFNEFNKLN